MTPTPLGWDQFIQRMMIGQPCRTAFTLLEVLAVIMLIALVAAVGSVSLVSTSASVDFARTIADFTQADNNARLHAQTAGEAVILELDPQRNELVLMASQTQERLSVSTVPPAIAARLKDDSGSIDSVLIDRLGRSRDYSVDLKSNDQNARLHFWGISGQWQKEIME